MLSRFRRSVLETCNKCRSFGILEQQMAVVCQLHNLFYSHLLKPFSLKGIRLILQHFGWQQKASGTTVLEETRRFLHKFLGKLFVLSALPWRIADNTVKCFAGKRLSGEKISLVNNGNICAGMVRVNPIMQEFRQWSAGSFHVMLYIRGVEKIQVG